MQPEIAPAVDVRMKALRRFAISITVLNILGHLFLGFEQAYLTPIAAVLTAYVLELLLERLDARAHDRTPRYRGSFGDLIDFLLPAHITGLACAMLLYANETLWPTMFAVTVGVASKYIVRVPVGRGWRHVLNPSNAGICVTLLVYDWVGIAPPYEFTENIHGVLDWVVPIAVGAAGAMLNGKLTRRLPLIAGWIGGFVLQAVFRAAVMHASLAGVLLPITGVAFILFTNYMITDPGTTPSVPRRQIAFGLATGLTYGALVLAHITFGLFFALGIVCGARFLGLAALATWRWLRAPMAPPQAVDVSVAEPELSSAAAR